MTNWNPARLVAAGYKVVSRAYSEVARIDRPDWREHIAAAHAPWDPEGEGMRWANSPGMEDHYRRCYSKDKLTIPPEWINKIGNSTGSDIGYIQQGSDKPCSNYSYKFSTARVVKRTKKALLITCEELDSATWVPKSIVISYAPLTLPGWFVQRLFDSEPVIVQKQGDFEGLCPYCGGQHCDCGTDI